MIKKLHFVGIGGSGISGVAKLAEEFGYIVTGCDLEKSTAYGKNIVQGHNPSHLKDVDLVVTSPALFYQEKENSEISAAKKMSKLVTWQEFLGKVLLKDKKLICIAGTHGKSTTTAMAGKLLIDNGFDPIVVVGAIVPEWRGNSRFGKGEYAVVEADEFNNNYLNYHPDIAIINNIEFDHPDFFKNEEEVRESFEKFIGNLVGQKILITEKDSVNKKFNLKIFGEHNQKNANMVFLLGQALGIREDKIVKSIEDFSGIERRLELIADRGEIKIYDDYAHHPTAIKTTLEGLRQEFPKNRIWAIVEPHGFARTKALLSNYKNVFKDVDKVLIGPIFKSRDTETFGMDASSITKISAHTDILGFDTFDQIKKFMSGQIKPGDIILVMGAGKSYLWAREIANLLPVSFSDLTTFRIGGKIKKYSEVKTEIEIKPVVDYAKQNTLPIFVLGEGSDILVSDKTFVGVVIRFSGKRISFEENGMVTAEAGASWDKLVEGSVERGLQGIECLSGIPGTVGAAPIQNIGAYGQEIKDVFVSLRAYDIKKNKFVTFSKDDCDFSYRQSIFKSSKYWQKFIVTSVTLKLSKKGSSTIKYDSLINFLTDRRIKNPSPLQVREAVLEIRAGKFEDPKMVGNAGSFFKNPVIDSKEKIRLEKEYPEIKTYSFGEKFKVAGGWLIEKAGWKGKSYKNAGVSSMHALILLNRSGIATAQDIYELSEQIIDDVYKKFGIRLEREVQLINF